MAKSKPARKQAAPVREQRFGFELKNEGQKEAYSLFQSHDVVFLIGPAGTGKTYLASAFAIQGLIRHDYHKIILSRPVVEAGEHLGHLPGEIGEKLDPYMRPLKDSINDLMRGTSPKQKEDVLAAIEIAPVAFMRGRTFSGAVVVLDEAQNATYDQLKMVLTRLGTDSKIIITGDPQQSDIGRRSGLLEVLQKLRPVEGIGIIELLPSGNLRHPMVEKIVNAL